MTLRDLFIYTPRLGVGGGELSLLRLAEGLARLGVQVTFVVHELTPLAQVRRPGVGVICLHSQRTLAAVLGLARCLRQHRPQALLAAFPHSNLAAVAARALARVPCTLVLSEHAPPRQQVAHMGGWRYSALPLLLRALYPRADAVVAVSQGVKVDLVGLSAGHLAPQVIYNPVLPADLTARMAGPAAHPWLETAGLEVVLALARLSDEKDLPTLLQAFALLAAVRPKARLVVCGEGPQRRALQALAQDLSVAPRVALVGVVANPFASLARARAFALSSRFEGFGNVLVEAMACGVPVVSTDCPVGPREILQDGRYGALVPVGDAPALAAALARALDGGQPEGARAFAQQFTEDRCAAAYRKLIETLLPAA